MPDFHLQVKINVGGITSTHTHTHTVTHTCSNGGYTGTSCFAALPAATALRRAFSHHGKPYDFNFDFATSDKIVCSELVYHAYQGLLDFELETVLGKTVVTPLGIARKFAREHGTPQAQLEFVLFLDTPRGARRARFVTAAEGLRSVNRAKAFNE